MHDAGLLLPAALSGLVCGVGFFGGLWWTIQRGLRSKRAALWFFGSTLIRTGGVSGVFVWIAQSDPKRALASVGGFCVARAIAHILGRCPPPTHPATPMCRGVAP